jgi:serine/threonine protein kinase/Flp pilus assembly protein TadD
MKHLHDSTSDLAGILGDYLTALEAGQAPDKEELLSAHPELAERLTACLESLELVHLVAEAEGPAPAMETADPGSRSLGDFRIRREIGRGGMGSVYEAEQISLARRVALKVLPFASVLDPRQLQRFKNEARAAALLHHSHIVPVHSVGCERGVHYYAMQYVDGLSGSEIIHMLRASAERGEEDPAPSSASSVLDAISKDRSSESPIYCREVARLGLQAAEALEYAHEQGVIHRDIKPSNLLVDDRAHLWITDFGLASSGGGSGLTLTGDLVGTVRYMSPEQTRPRSFTVDHRTDIYSLGVTLYEFMTLEDAFPSDDLNRVVEEIQNREPVPARRLNPMVSPDLENILLKSMAKERDERYETAGDLADDLRRFLEERPVTARRPSVLLKAAKWARRHRPLVLATAVLTGLTVIGLSISTALLQAAYRGEERERERAEAYLAKALDAVDQMLTHVGQRRLAHVPRMGDVRRALLEDALRFYQGFLGESGGDAAVRHETAHAWRRVADIRRMLGDREDAEPAYRQALKLTEELIPTLPDVTSLLLDRVSIQRKLGEICYETRRFDEADASYLRALSLAKDLAHAHQEKAELRRELAACRNGLGLVRLATRRLSEAEEEFLRARPILESLTETFPEIPDYAEDLGACLSNLGIVVGLDDRPEEAERLLRRAIEIRERLIGEFPGDPGYRCSLAGTMNNLGSLLRRSDPARWNEAEDCLRRARALLKALVGDFPGVARYRTDFVGISGNLATLLADDGDFESELQVYREGAEFMPEDAQAHMVLACHLADCRESRLRDLAAAIAAANRAVTLAPEAWDSWNALGTVRYRGGDWKGALAALEDSIRKEKTVFGPGHHRAVSSGANGFNWFLLAMTKWQLGAEEDARDWYDMAVEWMETNRPHDRRLRRLRSEAGGLLGL